MKRQVHRNKTFTVKVLHRNMKFPSERIPNYSGLCSQVTAAYFLPLYFQVWPFRDICLSQHHLISLSSLIFWQVGKKWERFTASSADFVSFFPPFLNTLYVLYLFFSAYLQMNLYQNTSTFKYLSNMLEIRVFKTLEYFLVFDLMSYLIM